MLFGLSVIGRTNLVLRVVTRTVDAFGQLSTTSTSDTTFTGDLQFGPDLDQRFITSGIVEVGEAVLYIEETALSTLPNPQDQVIDSNSIAGGVGADSVWEIVEAIEAPEVGGDGTFRAYRCRRRINAGDS